MATLAGMYVVLSLNVRPFTAGLFMAVDAIKDFTQSVANVGVSAVKTAADFESMEVGLRVMTGSAQKARSIMDDLTQFAATTPFTFMGLAKETQRLTAMGFAADEAVGLIKKLGDLAAVMPEGIEQGLARITRALGQMRSKGTVQAEEFMQLAEVGIPAWEALANRIGKTIPEAMALVERRMVSAHQGILAILDLATSPKFAGAMVQQSQTINGLLSTLKDNTQLLMRDLGQKIITAFDVKGGISGVTDLFDFLRSKVDAIVPALQLVGAGFRAAFDVGLSLIRQVVEVFTGWTAALDASPAALNNVRDTVVSGFKAVTLAVYDAWQTVKGFFSGVGEFTGGIGNVFDMLRKGVNYVLIGFNKIGEVIADVIASALEWLSELADKVGLGFLGDDNKATGLREFAENRRKSIEDAYMTIHRINNKEFDAKAAVSADPFRNQLAGRFDAEMSAAVRARDAMKDVGIVGLQAFAPLGAATGLLRDNLLQVRRASEAFLKVEFGVFSKGVTDAVKAARTPLEEFKDQMQQIAMQTREVLPHAAAIFGQAFMGNLAGVASMTQTVSQALDALNLKRLSTLEALEKKLGPSAQNTPALEAGSKEAVSVINAAINAQNRGGGGSVQERIQRALEADREIQKQQLKKLERIDAHGAGLARALEGLGVI